MRPFILPLSLLLSFVALSGCKKSTTEDDLGLEQNLGDSSAKYSFNSGAHPKHEVSEGSYASFLYLDEEGLCAINIGSLGEQSYNTSLYIVGESCPNPGKHTVAASADTAEDQQVWGTYLMPSEGSFPQTLTTHGGTVTITKSSADRLQGDFEIQLRELQEESTNATITGSFRAQRAPGSVVNH